ncbi:GDNF-inducible zinc finger protein 1-like [Argonauta hians]
MMEQLNTISTDVLQQFKAKLKEAIYLFNSMPDCLKLEAVQHWKILSVAIKFSPSDQPTPSDEDLREVELQPVEEVVTSLTESTTDSNDTTSLMVLGDKLRVTYSDQAAKLLTEGNVISSNEDEESPETIFYPNIDIVTCDGTGEKQTLKLPPPVDIVPRLCAKKNVPCPKQLKNLTDKRDDGCIKLENENLVEIESKLNNGTDETCEDKKEDSDNNGNSLMRKSKRIRIRKDKTDLYFDVELSEGNGPPRLIGAGQNNLSDPLCIEALDILSKEVKATIQPQIEYKKKKTNYQSSNGAFTCEICGLEVQYLASLIVHRRRHSGEKPFTCSTCGRGFTTNGNKLRHEKTHSGEKPFECQECKKRFTEKKSLKVHMRSHTGERPYKCKICGRGFAQTGILQTHIYLHTGHKGHLCDTCGKAFRQKSQLRLHQKRHSNQRTFLCPETDCSASFFTKGDLQRHKLKHSGARPFLCTVCPKTFTRLQYLKEHLNQHTGTKPYTCKLCNLSFYDMSTYYRHIRRHKVGQDSGGGGGGGGVGGSIGGEHPLELQGVTTAGGVGRGGDEDDEERVEVMGVRVAVVDDVHDVRHHHDDDEDDDDDAATEEDKLARVAAAASSVLGREVGVEEAGDLGVVVVGEEEGGGIDDVVNDNDDDSRHGHAVQGATPVMTYIVTSADEACKALDLEQQAVVAAAAAAAEPGVPHPHPHTHHHHHPGSVATVVAGTTHNPHHPHHQQHPHQHLASAIPSDQHSVATGPEVYQITVDPSLIARDEHTGQPMVTTVDFSAINLLANATTEQYLST